MIILLNPLAVLKANPQIALRLRITRLGGGAHGFEGIPRFTVSRHLSMA
jgi:hypothetical protein